MPGYSPEALERGIEKCKENVKIFEEAIDKERETMKEYRFMIDTAERKQREREMVQQGMKIVVEKKDGD